MKRTSTDDLRVVEIGYQQSSLDWLCARLRRHGVATVVDIRELPWSRKRGFSKTALSRALEQIGISYIHMKEAGNPKENRRQARTAQECLALYRSHLEENDSFLNELYDIIRTHKTALLCYEAELTECHRSVILEEMSTRWPQLKIQSA